MATIITPELDALIRRIFALKGRFLSETTKQVNWKKRIEDDHAKAVEKWDPSTGEKEPILWYSMAIQDHSNQVLSMECDLDDLWEELEASGVSMEDAHQYWKKISPM
jgi:hypothetical protein